MYHTHQLMPPYSTLLLTQLIAMITKKHNDSVVRQPQLVQLAQHGADLVINVADATATGKPTGVTCACAKTYSMPYLAFNCNS